MIAGPRFFRSHRVPVVLQAEAAECGLACLAMIAGAHGRRTDLAGLRGVHGGSLRGMTLRRLMAVASGLDLVPRAVRAEPGELRRLRLPCVLHWNLDHFVVLEKLGTRSLRVVDPALGRRCVSRRELGRQFTGVALELVPAAGFEPRDDREPLRLREFAGATRGLGRALGVLLALSTTLQALALLMPFYSQVVIDSVVLRGDRELLVLLACAFGLVVVMQALFAMARAWVVVTLATRLNLDWSVRVFRHLLRLPLAWFERRQVGDVQSRFGSVAALQQLLTRQFVETVVDGGMALTTFAVMALYDLELALLVLASIVAYAVLRAALFPSLRQTALEALAAGARRDGLFLESLRGMLAVKTCGLESLREAVFAARQAEAGSAAAAQARLGVWQLGGHRLLFGLQLVAVTALGAVAILDGRFTVGMLVAFMSYRGLFSDRAGALVDRLFEFRLARVRLERLADIVCSPAESEGETLPRRVPATPVLAARRLGHRHGPGEPWLFRDLDFTIRAGEHVALTGESGCGKTTLVKLLAGLVEPASGTVCVDGCPLERFGRRAFRDCVAAVMQEDQLFSGTIADNLTRFAERPDLARCRRCARIADIDATIDALPMGYDTPVGDMGTGLSGGQKQRLLLARALYAGPRILFLDEFTSHLDAASEARIHARLSRLPLTLVVVAHRLETRRFAAREIRLPAPAGTLLPTD